jgi:hypothetical protein
VRRGGELLEVIYATDATGFGLGRAEGRKQERRQDRNDGDNDEDLDEGEGVSTATRGSQAGFVSGWTPKNHFCRTENANKRYIFN